MTDEWTKVKSEVWKPEEGEEISGIYLGVQKEVGTNASNLYKIECEEKTLSVWGSKILDDAMLSVKEGQGVKIKFKGKVKPEKGNEYKTYEVFTRDLQEPPITEL